MTQCKENAQTPATAQSYPELLRRTFLTEGTMLALPLCFPGATVPIDPNDSHVVSLDATPSGEIYGLAVGERSHLFVAMTRGITGFCFDMGVLPAADRGTAVACSAEGVFVFAGASIHAHKLQALPFDCIQEWGFDRTPFVGPVFTSNAGPFHAVVPTPGRRLLVAATKEEVLVLEAEKLVLRPTRSLKLRTRPDARLTVTSDGAVFGLDDKNGLWRLNPDSGALETDLWIPTLRRDTSGPQGAAFLTPIAGTGDLLVGTGQELWRIDPANRRGSLAGRVSIGPVTSMAGTFDGRVYGSEGREIQHLFVYDPQSGETRDIGIAVSVLFHRRYGYQFAEAATGTQGEIILGEDDRGGHLWMYLPAVRPARQSRRTSG